MRLNFKDLTERGFNVATGLEYTGGSEGFLFILQRYFKSAGKVSESLSDALIKHDLEEYARIAHSLKSNSKMIGASDFARLAEEAEMMAKEGNFSGILLKTPDLLVKLNDVVEIIRPYGEMEEVHPLGALSGDEARAVGEELLAALDEYDDERSVDLIDKLIGYPFRARQRSMLKDAIDLVADYSYEEASEIVSEVLKEVED